MKKKFKIILDKLKLQAKRLKKEISALYLAYKRPDVPWYAKVLSIIVVGYAISPIDLIPDFIPIIGYLDDLLLLPIGIMIVIKLIPDNIMDECRKEAENIFKEDKFKSWIPAFIIVFIWVSILMIILKNKFL